MKVCPTCRMHYSREQVLCPGDRTLLLLSDPEWEALLDYGAETVLVFRPVVEPCEDDSLDTPEPFDLDSFDLHAFDPESRTGAWFAEGQRAEAELSSAAPLDPLPALYSRALEEEDTDRTRLLRHMPWAVSLGLAGFAVVMLTLL